MNFAIKAGFLWRESLFCCERSVSRPGVHAPLARPLSPESRVNHSLVTPVADSEYLRLSRRCGVRFTFDPANGKWLRLKSIKAPSAATHSCRTVERHNRL